MGRTLAIVLALALAAPASAGERPFAYLIPAKYRAGAEALQRQGIKVQELREDIELAAEGDAIKSVGRAERTFQKRALAKVELTARPPAPRRVEAGTLVVKADQPLDKLAPYLLDPAAADGLTAWNSFGAKLKPGELFPVLRLSKPYPMTLGAVRPLPEGAGAKLPVTEAVLVGHGGGFTFGFAGSPVNPGAWLDAEHFLQVKGGKLWKVVARTGKAELFANADKLKKSLGALKDIDDKTAEKLARAASFRFNPGRTAFLFDIGQDLGLAHLDGAPAVRLTTSGGNREYVTFSPDGQRLAFVRGNNLFAVDVATRKEVQLTHDGGKEVFNGKGDWVYEEEIFNRNGRAFWWSPDGARLAFLRIDDAPVKKFHVVNPLSNALESYAYPKPGEPNPLVKVGVVSADGGKPTYLDLSGYEPGNTLVSRVGWVGKTDAVFAYVQNRTQTWLDFVVWDAPGAKPKVLFRETTPAWVDDAGEPHWLADGTFLFPSERDGWKHLYHYSADGKLLARVTKGEWEVRDVLRVDAKEKTVYFTANMTSATGSDFCRVEFGREVELLGARGQSHRVALAPSGGLWIDRYTDPMTPTRVAVCEVGKGRVRTLDTNPVYEREKYRFGKYERVTIPTKDGFALEGAITYPPDFDATKKYPVWLFTYGGPHAPTIRDEYGGGRILEQSLATSGIIAFRVDPRSASGKGARSAWACYKQLGVRELKDLEEAVAWLAERPYIDASRVGISGHSYGGFVAAYALTHSKTFSAGIASSAVTDWHLYDSIYTERYMLTPKENPEGYAKSSCVAAAKDLGGKLLVVHGMMDDNVHAQNGARLIDALQKANRPFEMMFYPPARHGIAGQHYLKLQLEFIRRTMGAAK